MRLVSAVVLGCVRLLPLALFAPLAAVLAALTSLLMPFFGGKAWRQLQLNVAKVYGLPAGTYFARSFARQVIYHQVACGLETLRLVQQPGLAVVAGADVLAARLSAVEAGGQPHVMITAHLGSWELCAYFVQHRGSRDFHVLAKPPRLAALTAVLEGLRRGMGVKVLWTDRKTLVREMMAALKAGLPLGFVMDQKPEGRQGPVVSFLGWPTAFVSGPAAMATRFGAAVTGIYCLREGPFRYRLVTQALSDGVAAGTDAAHLTGQMAAAIETVVRAYPEQWTWTYRRWRFS